MLEFKHGTHNAQYGTPTGSFLIPSTTTGHSVQYHKITSIILIINEILLSYIWDRNDVDEKLNKFRNICGTIHRYWYLKNKTKKETRIRFSDTVAIPVLVYGDESEL